MLETEETEAAGRLYRSSIAQHTAANIATAAQALQAARAAEQVPGHAGPVVLCKKIGSFNFGHWLLEMWPRAILAREHLHLTDLRYAVHALDGPLAQVMRASLTLAGIAENAMIDTPWEPQFFADLFLIDGLTEHGRYMSPLAVRCLDRLIAPVPQGAAERLYVTRHSASWRRFEHEAAMIRIAEREGYAVVDPGEMGLLQQISIFKGARRVVGIIGAAMTNTAFMAPGGQVGVFVPATMPDNFFWFISQIRQHEYREFRA